MGVDCIMEAKYSLMDVYCIRKAKYSLMGVDCIIEAKYSLMGVDCIIEAKYSLICADCIIEAKYSPMGVDCIIEASINIISAVYLHMHPPASSFISWYSNILLKLLAVHKSHDKFVVTISALNSRRPTGRANVAKGNACVQLLTPTTHLCLEFVSR